MVIERVKTNKHLMNNRDERFLYKSAVFHKTLLN